MEMSRAEAKAKCERQRKQNISDAIIKLKALIPDEYTVSQSTLDVLNAAFKYLTDLKLKVDNLLFGEKDDVKGKEILKLQQMLENAQCRCKQYAEILDRAGIPLTIDKGLLDFSGVKPSNRQLTVSDYGFGGQLTEIVETPDKPPLIAPLSDSSAIVTAQIVQPAPQQSILIDSNCMAAAGPSKLYLCYSNPLIQKRPRLIIPKLKSRSPKHQNDEAKSAKRTDNLQLNNSPDNAIKRPVEEQLVNTTPSKVRNEPTVSSIQKTDCLLAGPNGSQPALKGVKAQFVDVGLQTLSWANAEVQTDAETQPQPSEKSGETGATENEFSCRNPTEIVALNTTEVSTSISNSQPIEKLVSLSTSTTVSNEKPAIAASKKSLKHVDSHHLEQIIDQIAHGSAETNSTSTEKVINKRSEAEKQTKSITSIINVANSVIAANGQSEEDEQQANNNVESISLIYNSANDNQYEQSMNDQNQFVSNQSIANNYQPSLDFSTVFDISASNALPSLDKFFSTHVDTNSSAYLPPLSSWSFSLTSSSVPTTTVSNFGFSNTDYMPFAVPSLNATVDNVKSSQPVTTARHTVERHLQKGKDEKQTDFKRSQKFSVDFLQCGVKGNRHNSHSSELTSLSSDVSSQQRGAILSFHPGSQSDRLNAIPFANNEFAEVSSTTTKASSWSVSQFLNLEPEVHQDLQQRHFDDIPSCPNAVASEVHRQKTKLTGNQKASKSATSKYKGSLTSPVIACENNFKKRPHPTAASEVNLSNSIFDFIPEKKQQNNNRDKLKAAIVIPISDKSDNQQVIPTISEGYGNSYQYQSPAWLPNLQSTSCSGTVANQGHHIPTGNYWTPGNATSYPTYQLPTYDGAPTVIEAAGHSANFNFDPPTYFSSSSKGYTYQNVPKKAKNDPPRHLPGLNFELITAPVQDLCQPTSTVLYDSSGTTCSKEYSNLLHVLPKISNSTVTRQQNSFQIVSMLSDIQPSVNSTTSEGSESSLAVKNDFTTNFNRNFSDAAQITSCSVQQFDPLINSVGPTGYFSASAVVATEPWQCPTYTGTYYPCWAPSSAPLPPS